MVSLGLELGGGGVGGGGVGGGVEGGSGGGVGGRGRVGGAMRMGWISGCAMAGDLCLRVALAGGDAAGLGVGRRWRGDGGVRGAVEGVVGGRGGAVWLGFVWGGGGGGGRRRS